MDTLEILIMIVVMLVLLYLASWFAGSETAITNLNPSQLARIKKDVTEVELDRAREMAKGRLLLALENSRNVANWLGAQEILTGKIMTVDEITAKIDAMTVSDIRRVAERLLQPDKLNLAVVGPIDKSEEKFLSLLNN